MDASYQSALFQAQQPSLPTRPSGIVDPAQAAHAAKEYESVFIAQFLGAMFSGIKADGITGGGEGEMMFRSLMVDKYAEGLQAQGGFGFAGGTVTYNLGALATGSKATATLVMQATALGTVANRCLLYTSPSPRD